MTTVSSSSEAASQPESLDLAFDDWEGQFEFVGPVNNYDQQNLNLYNNNNNNNNNNNDIDDLNLNCSDVTNGYRTQSINNNNNTYNLLKQQPPILIDEETFLSLHPNDFIDSDSGPQSEYFIENLNYINNVGNGDDDDDDDDGGGDGGGDDHIIKNNKNCYNNKFLNLNNNNNKLTVEEIINLKNRINSEGFNQKSTNNNKMNGYTAEICDNLSEQLEILQRQVTNLADTQNDVDDRTLRSKTDYAVLQARYHMLEEQISDIELRANERIAEEQKRHRELLARVEREAVLQNENCQIKINTIEIEANALKEEVHRLRIQCDKQAVDLHTTEEKLENARYNLLNAQEELMAAKANEKKYHNDKLAAEELMIELGKEVERLRSESGPALPTTSPETLRLEELHQELEDLRQTNKNLLEQNDELHAMVLTRGLEEGRSLLNGTSNSLAQELDDMSQVQDSVDSTTLASLTQLQLAYQDKEDENQRLKHYIDTILINIVENYPQLLEVKTPAKCKQ